MRGHRLAFATVVVWMCAWHGVAHAAISTSPGTIATTPVNIGVTSPAATGTLTNSVNGNVKVDIVLGSCSGAGAGTFAFNPQSNISLNPSDTISVTYTPSALGPRSCSVNVFPLGTTSGALTTFTVTGDGQRPPTIVAGTIMPFGSLRYFDGAVAAKTSLRTLTIDNSGDLPLVISSVTVSGGEFTIDSTSPNGAGGTTITSSPKSWVLKFDPSAAGTRNGTITFASNDPTTPSKVVNLTGDGTTGSFSIAANGAFGTIASGTSSSLDIVVTHDGNSPKGTLTFNSATITNASQPWFAIAGQPGTLSGTTTTGNVTVSCSPPAGATATATATVNVIADSDGTAATGNRETRSQNFSCTGGASLLALSSATVDFAPQLVGTTSGAQTVTITNSGTSNASVQFTGVGGNAARFTAIGPGGCGGGTPCAIAMGGGTVDVSVTFSPTIEQSVGASFTLSGAGPQVGFVVNGRGIDRHILLPEAIQVADTFRNPGSRSTRSSVPIENSGEYPIIITSLQMGGDDSVWSIDDETLAALPITVPGLSTAALGTAFMDLYVRFAPNAAGKAEDGQLLIANDDMKVALGMPIVVMGGNGKDRNVDMSPGAIDVGETFAGVPTRLSISRPDDMLSVINQEMPDGDNNDFVIREIKVEGDDFDMFQVQDLDGKSLDNRSLAAGESLRVDVVFNPTHVGDFEATLVLYLDEDPQYVRLIPVRGRALFIDAHGSGGFGCSTGNGSRGAMGLLIVVLGLILRRRRR